jgi:hypothetical protein
MTRISFAQLIVAATTEKKEKKALNTEFGGNQEKCHMNLTWTLKIEIIVEIVTET